MGQRRGFTFVELLVTISAIAIMATLVMVASYNALESAKEAKTKATIVKLNSIVMAKYEGYRTRRVTISPLPANAPLELPAKVRLDALRDLMRLELPDRWTDIIDPPGEPFQDDNSNGQWDVGESYSDLNYNGVYDTHARPAVSQAYLRRFEQINANATPAQKDHFNLFQGAECLYMIVTLGLTDELGGRDHFSEGSIGDADGDGFPEFWDAWKNPICFLRWAPGFPSELQQGNTAGYVTSSSSATSIVGNVQLSLVDNTYTGRAILLTSGSHKGQAAQIVRYLGDTQTFTLCPEQLASAPASGDSFVILPEDPFDSRHVYPAAEVETIYSPLCPTFALYPLIYSAGPDEIFDIVSDSDARLIHSAGPDETFHIVSDSKATLRYAEVNNNPFVGYLHPAFTSGQMGSVADLKSTSRTGVVTDANNVNNAADNIHNHLIETRVNR